MNPSVPKMLGSSQEAEQLAVPQEGLRSMELVNDKIIN
jgi:hypothetical protein